MTKPLLKRLSAAAIFIGSVDGAQASCPLSTVFACTTTNNKVVEVCDSGDKIDYSFGKKGQKPELALSVLRRAASTVQWQGIGRHMYYSVRIPNGNTIYEVFSSIDKLEQSVEAGIYVTVNGENVATILCKPDTRTDYLEGLALPLYEG